MIATARLLDPYRDTLPGRVLARMGRHQRLRPPACPGCPGVRRPRPGGAGAVVRRVRRGRCGDPGEWPGLVPPCRRHPQRPRRPVGRWRPVADRPRCHPARRVGVRFHPLAATDVRGSVGPTPGGSPRVRPRRRGVRRGSSGCCWPAGSAGATCCRERCSRVRGRPCSSWSRACTCPSPSLARPSASGSSASLPCCSPGWSSSGCCSWCPRRRGRARSRAALIRRR